eukprot:3293259-Pleurochrysis_carterae.AAC.1
MRGVLDVRTDARTRTHARTIHRALASRCRPDAVLSLDEFASNASRHQLHFCWQGASMFAFAATFIASYHGLPPIDRKNSNSLPPP